MAVEPVAAPPTEELILSYLYPKTFNCPVCEKDFIDFVVRKSKLRTVKTDTDFMTVYKDIDPNHYEILFCSHCGYAQPHNYFDKITMRQQQMIREKITINYKPMEFPMPLTQEHVMLRFKQAILCADAIDAKVSQKAFISLRLAWVLRRNGNKDLEMRFMREAYDGLKQAFMTERFPLGSMDEPTAKYIIADLGRRLGDFGEAMRWVGDLMTAKGIPGMIKDRAVNLKDLIREGVTT